MWRVSSPTSGIWSVRGVDVCRQSVPDAVLLWVSSRDFSPSLPKKYLSLLTRDKVYNTCVRSVMLDGSEAWAHRVTQTACSAQSHDLLDMQCETAGQDYLRGALARLKTKGCHFSHEVLQAQVAWLCCLYDWWHSCCYQAGCPKWHKGKGRHIKTWKECVKDIHEVGLTDLDPLDSRLEGRSQCG